MACSQRRWVEIAYWLFLFVQMGLVVYTWKCVSVMHQEWEKRNDALAASKPHTVLSWPFHGAVRAFVLDHDCEHVFEEQRHILEFASPENASCFLGSDDQKVWHYWPPSKALDLRLSNPTVLARNQRAVSRADAAAEVASRQLHTEPGENSSALWILEEMIDTLQDGAIASYDTGKAVAKTLVDPDVMDTGRLTTYMNQCTNQKIMFGHVGWRAKYLNLIFLGASFDNLTETAANFMENATEHANASMAGTGWTVPSWSMDQLRGSETVEKPWSEKRKEEYDRLQKCLLACLFIKVLVGKINACLAKMDNRFLSSRSRCDKRWETLFIELFSWVLFICIQSTLSTMFVLVWRVNCAIATNIPSRGLIFCVCLFVLISVVNELDKCREWSATCGCRGRCFFWVGFCVVLVVVTIPLLALTYYNIQFLTQAYECQISQRSSHISVAFKEAAKLCSICTGLFLVCASTELLLLFWMDWDDSEREQRPTTLPRKVVPKRYTLLPS